MVLDFIARLVSYPLAHPYETAFGGALVVVIAGLVYFFFKFNRDVFRTVDIIWVANGAAILVIIVFAVVLKNPIVSAAMAVTMLGAVVAEVLYFRNRGGAAIAPRRDAKVAILPLMLGGGTEEEWITGYGLADMVSRALSACQIGVLDPYRAAVGFERRAVAAEQDAWDWGEALEVNYLVTGRTRHIGHNIQIRYKVVGLFDRREWVRPRLLIPAVNPFDGAAVVFEDIVELFNLQVNNEAALAYYRQPTATSAAWENYCRGRRHQIAGGLDDLEKAREEFQKALAADENFALAAVAAVEVHLALARRQVRDEERFLSLLDDAYRLALRTVRQRPELYETQNVMGEVFVFLSGGRDADLFRRAQTRFLEAVRLNPNSARSWYNLALISKYSVPEEDVGYADFLGKALSADPSYLAAHLALGRYFAEHDDAEGARRQYRLALTYNPRNTGALNELGYFYLKRNDGPHAAEILEKSKEIDGANATTRYYLGLAYRQENDTARAEEEFWAAVAFKPDDVTYLRELALSLEAGDKPAEAISVWEEVLKRTPEAAEAHKVRGHMMRLAEKIRDVL